MPRPRALRTIANVVLVLSTPVAMAWLVGDLSRPTIPGLTTPSDRRTSRRSWDTRSVRSGLVLVVASIGVIARTWPRPARSGLLPVPLPLVAIGVIAGFMWRVMTAAVNGINFGAAFVVTPVVAALAVLALTCAHTRRPG